ncbi:MAG: ATP-binding protein [Gemmatimonadaceae bacterium]
MRERSDSTDPVRNARNSLAVVAGGADANDVYVMGANVVSDVHHVSAAVLDPARIAALARTGLLYGAPEPGFDRLTRLTATVLRVPVALVSIVDVDRQVFVGCLGLPEPWASRRQTPLSHSFCQHVVETRAPLIISDARVDPLVRDNLAVRELGVVAYAGIPLLTPDGSVLGSFCVIDTVPRDWTEKEIALLTSLAESATTEIALRTSQRAAAESAARLEAAIDGADLGAWSYNFPSSSWWHSTRANEIFGGAATEAVLTRDEWLGRVHAEDRESVRKLLDNGGTSGDHFLAQFRLIDLAGETRWMSANGRVLRDSMGIAERIVGTLQDVTRRVEFEAEREHLYRAESLARADAESARAIADAANRAKSDFLTMMSHELRTPLNAIGGYAELIEMGIRGPVTEEQRSDLARIKRSQRHLLGLINGVLSYAKVDAGAVHFELADVSMEEVLTTCEALIAPQMRAKELSLAQTMFDRTMTVRADREKTEQIVLNLLSNAVKFTNAGGAIEISCAAETPQSLVSISVADTGIGISAQKLDRVFEPFVQLDAPLTRTHEGTGLGLAISRELARGMGGDIAVSSTPGVGSRFTLTLLHGSRA